MANARLASGAGWTYGGLALTSIAQFGYAAITSRALSSTEFGAYAAALAAAGLVTVLANAGLAQSVARMIDLDRTVISALALYALSVGALAALALFLLAGPWAALWGSPESTSVIQLLAIPAMVSPLAAVASGVLRRQGRYIALAVVTLVCNLVGMTIGASLVALTRDGDALVVFTIVTQVSMTLVLLVLTRRQMFGRPSWRLARADIGFSGKAVVSALLSWTVGSLPAFSISRGVGQAQLGQWNRAEVLTSIPFQQIQTAIITPLYPELRHDRQNSLRAQRVWTDMFAATSWVAYLLGATAAALGPLASSIIFGPGWELAAALIPSLAVIAALQTTSSVIGVAVEVLGRFRIIYLVQILGILIQAISAFAVIALGSIWPAIVGLVALNLARQITYLAYLSRIGYIRLSANLIRQARISVVALAWWTLLFCGIYSVTASHWMMFAIVIVICATAIVLLFRRWRSLEPVRLAYAYFSNKPR